MPTIKTILETERSKATSVAVGFEEGNFIRFYEHSACMMSTVHGLKPSKKTFKNIGLEIVSVGFPKTSRQKYMPTGTLIAEGVWQTSVEPLPDVDFDAWKQSVPCGASEPKDDRKASADRLARVRGLPVFKACYDLLLYVMQWSVNVGRDLRFTVGEDLKRSLVDVELCIYRANKCAASDRMSHVVKAQETLEEALIYTRLLYDMRQIALAQYAHTAELAAEVEKQLANWRRSLTGLNEKVEGQTGLVD